MQTIELSKLVPGNDVNVRSDRKSGIKDLAASIERNGLLQSLLVEPQGDKFRVIAGNRRLAALTSLSKAKKIDKDTPVACVVAPPGDTSDAIRLSLIENIDRLPIHEVDQFEAFSKMVEQGMTEAQIASRFAISDRMVAQRLALGKLAPAVREAWRKGTVDTEAAQAFTLGSIEVQEAYLKSVKKNEVWKLSVHSVRSAMTESKRRTEYSREFDVVGREAYVAAGGMFKADLFSEDEYIESPDILEKLFREKVDVELEKYRAQGWKWVAYDDDLDGHSWQYKDAPIPLTDEESAAIEKAEKLPWGQRREITDPIYEAATARVVADPEFRAQYGVIVSLEDEGFSPEYGKIAPEHAQKEDDDETEEKAPASPKKADEPGPYDVTSKVQDMLRETATVALAKCVASNEKVALALLATSLVSQHHHAPARISVASQWVTEDLGKLLNELRVPTEVLEVDKTFEAIVILQDADVRRILVAATAASVNMTTGALTNRGCDWKLVSSIADELPTNKNEDPLRDAVVREFDPDAYFAAMKGAAATEAIKELKQQAPQGKKKAEIAGEAAEAAKAAGWTPPQLSKFVHGGEL
ncbi:MAG: ParB/RepB/Spo0J family partition protein [Beijerinckiaceae bacterium]